MADVQIAVIDTTENQVNVAVPGVQGPIGLTGSVAIAQDGTATEPGIRFESDTNTGIYSPGADQLAISTDGTGRLFVDASGNVAVGASTYTGGLTIFRDQGQTTANISTSTDIGSFFTARHNSSAAGAGGGLILGAQVGSYAAIKGMLTNGSSNTSGDIAFATRTAASDSALSEKLRLTSTGRLGLGTSAPSSLLHLADAGDITVGTTTGTKIGTATTQKLGFYNATPVVQPTAVADATDAVDVITQLNALLTRMRNLGLIAT
jgi:hypothetical protein